MNERHYKATALQIDGGMCEHQHKTLADAVACAKETGRTHVVERERSSNGWRAKLIWTSNEGLK